jgi:hypothetical protein
MAVAALVPVRVKRRIERVDLARCKEPLDCQKLRVAVADCQRPAERISRRAATELTPCRSHRNFSVSDISAGVSSWSAATTIAAFAAAMTAIWLEPLAKGGA